MLSPPFGFLNIDKPLGLTSHDVVARVRRNLNVKKVGHAGTLDPLATGVLVVCVGAATRLSEYVMNTTKRYEALVHLGVETETYDAEGAIVAEQAVNHVTQTDVEQALTTFLGPIDQLPPIYSAIKQGGRKLYEIARAGETAELQPRHVTIYALDILDWQPPFVRIAVTCSAGTYIRSLAHDLGAALGVGGSLDGLTRTASGRFALSDAIALDTLIADPDWTQRLVIPQTALSDWLQVHPDADRLADIEHGRAIPAPETADGTLALAFRPDESLVAVLKAFGGDWVPEKVFLT